MVRLLTTVDKLAIKTSNQSIYGFCCACTTLNSKSHNIESSSPRSHTRVPVVSGVMAELHFYDVSNY